MRPPFIHHGARLGDAVRRLLTVKRNSVNAPHRAAHLKERTLTKLCNERPAWLTDCHARLDGAVAAAYGWPADLTDETILERLLTLNQAATR